MRGFLYMYIGSGYEDDFFFLNLEETLTQHVIFSLVLYNMFVVYSKFIIVCRCVARMEGAGGTATAGDWL